MPNDARSIATSMRTTDARSIATSMRTTDATEPRETISTYLGTNSPTSVTRAGGTPKTAVEPARFAYADPPYLGMGRRLYGKHHPDAARWDDMATHLDLIGHLVQEFPDGWALSCLQRDLRWVMPAVPEDCRVAAWVKPFGSGYKPGQRIIWAWEPVVFRTARTREPGTRVRDVLSANATRQVGLPGAKPDTFNQWVISLLGCGPDDELVDLFPGSGGLGRARDQGRLAL